MRIDLIRREYKTLTETHGISKVRMERKSRIAQKVKYQASRLAFYFLTLMSLSSEISDVSEGVSCFDQSTLETNIPEQQSAPSNVQQQHMKVKYSIDQLVNWKKNEKRNRGLVLKFCVSLEQCVNGSDQELYRHL